MGEWLPWMLESWKNNNLYGVGRALREYAGLPWYYPLNLRIQHGVSLWSMFCSLHCSPEREAYTPRGRDEMLLVMNEDGARLFREGGVRNVRAIGAPILYLDDFIATVRPARRKGTLVFPHHSLMRFDTRTDYDVYADELAGLPASFHPIKVCLYPVDMRRGRDRAFREKGFEVVANGSHPWDPAFMHNFVRNAMPCEFAASNSEISSTLYYAVYLGLKAFRFGPPCRDPNASPADSHVCSGPPPYEFPFEAREDVARQKAVADAELGVPLKLSRDEMRRLIAGACTARFLAGYIPRTILRWPHTLFWRILGH